MDTSLDAEKADPSYEDRLAAALRNAKDSSPPAEINIPIPPEQRPPFWDDDSDPVTLPGDVPCMLDTCGHSKLDHDEASWVRHQEIARVKREWQLRAADARTGGTGWYAKWKQRNLIAGTPASLPGTASEWYPWTTTIDLANLTTDLHSRLDRIEANLNTLMQFFGSAEDSR